MSLSMLQVITSCWACFRGDLIGGTRKYISEQLRSLAEGCTFVITRKSKEGVTLRNEKESNEYDLRERESLGIYVQSMLTTDESNL